MPSVVFLRGANVGGHRTFRPAALATELAKWKVVNVGAAGTFVALAEVAEATLERAIRKLLPFELPPGDVMIHSADSIAALTESAFGKASDAGEGAVKRYVSVLAAAPAAIPALPIERPSDGAWQVRFVRVTGRFALSLHRRGDAKRLVYPNEVVERALAVRATTRDWNTIAAVRKILDRP